MRVEMLFARKPAGRPGAVSASADPSSGWRAAPGPGHAPAIAHGTGEHRPQAGTPAISARFRDTASVSGVLCPPGPWEPGGGHRGPGRLGGRGPPPHGGLGDTQEQLTRPSLSVLRGHGCPFPCDLTVTSLCPAGRRVGVRKQCERRWCQGTGGVNPLCVWDGENRQAKADGSQLTGLGGASHTPRSLLVSGPGARGTTWPRGPRPPGNAPQTPPCFARDHGNAHPPKHAQFRADPR